MKRPIQKLAKGVGRAAPWALSLSLLAGCATPGNAPDVQCQRRPDGHLLVFHAVRDNLTHSIVLFLLSPTVKDRMELVVPRIAGLVPASEVIDLDNPSRHFDGALQFSGDSVDVKLIQAQEPRAPSDWNGRYRLGPCGS